MYRERCLSEFKPEETEGVGESHLVKERENEKSGCDLFTKEKKRCDGCKNEYWKEKEGEWRCKRANVGEVVNKHEESCLANGYE